MEKFQLSVTQITNYIKRIFEAEEMLIDVSVFGEITNFKISGRAIYFDIKDENASLPCVSFDMSVSEDIVAGDKVVVKGRPNFYIKTGKLSFIVSKIEKFGMGALYKKYLETKEKLEKEGVFDTRYKKQIPEFPTRVGVVTSETGAVKNDIIKVARRKNKSVDIVFYPAKVQGEGAVEQISRGIEFLDNYNVDCIIVARGGGSFEDYEPFNTEALVRKIFMCKKPVISAVGHENDWTLIDFVADARASTPSVASEIAFYDEEILLNKIKNNCINFYGKLETFIDTEKNKFINTNKQICSLVENKLIKQRSEMCACVDNCKFLISSLLESKKNKIELETAKISKLNPMSVLRSGYTKIEKENKPISSVKEVKVGDVINSRLFDGFVKSKVEEIKEIKK